METTNAIRFPGLGIEINPPEVVSLPWGLEIRWYGIIIAIGVLIAMIYGFIRVKRFGFSRDDLTDMLIVGVPFGIIFARLFFVVFKDFAHYAANPIEILYIWNGGMAIYGGIIGGMGAAAAVALFKKIKPLAALDLAAIAFPLAQAVGRVGNLINREAFGTPTGLPWRMALHKNGEWFTAHPCFLYEGIWNLIGFAVLHRLSKRRRFDGQVFLLYIAWYGLGRALIEGLRTDALVAGGIRVSQLLAIVSCVVAAALFTVFTYIRKPDPRKMQVTMYEERMALQQLQRFSANVEPSTAIEQTPTSDTLPEPDENSVSAILAELSEQQENKEDEE